MIALAPLLIISGVSTAVAVAFGYGIGRGWDVVLPHLTVVLTFVCLAYAWFPVCEQLGIRQRISRRLIFPAVLTFTSLLFLFYVAVLGSYFFFKELPTRQLVSGYLTDLPALLAALPLEKGVLVGIVMATLAIALGLGVAVAYSLDRGRECIMEFGARRIGRILTRFALYAGSTHILFAFAVPLDWHVQRNEPILSSWHDVRLATHYIFGQKNPVQVALDQRAEEAYPRKAARRTPNIVLVYVDALRADVTQPYGAARNNMPFISSMVERGVLQQVNSVVAACPSTLCGLAALLQSRPTWLQSRENFSLPRVLALQGYRNAYVLASNHQDFFNLKDYYRPFEFYMDGKDLRGNRHGDDYLVLDGLEILGKWDGRPTFLMIGLISPHVGGIRAEVNRQYRPDRFSLTTNSKAWGDAYRNNYDNGVLQADDVLRKVWEKLRDLRFLDDAIVVITSDHGESLGERGQWGHLRSMNYAELRVPLWIYDPQSAAGTYDFARQIDISPTILDAIGLPVPSTWHGRPLRELGDEVWSVHYVPDFRDKISVIRRQRNRIFKFDYDRADGSERVFDVVADPREDHDILASIPEPLLAEMRTQARAALLSK